VTQVSIGARVLTLLVRVVEGEGGRGAILPRLRAEVVVEARAGGHRLGVEVGREGAILQDRISSVSTQFFGRFNCNTKKYVSLAATNRQVAFHIKGPMWTNPAMHQPH
jgi:hypothetical protein